MTGQVAAARSAEDRNLPVRSDATLASNHGCRTARTRATTSRNVLVATRFSLVATVSDFSATGFASAEGSGSRITGMGKDAIPSLIGLGFNVHVSLRLTPDMKSVRNRLVAGGASVHVAPIRGRGSVEVGLPDGRGICVFPPADYQPTAADAQLLAVTNPKALVLGADLGPEFVPFMLESTAALGVPSFVVVQGDAPVPNLDRGGVVYLLRQNAGLSSSRSPAREVLDLHQQTGAAATFVQDRELGLLSVEGDSREVLHLPAAAASLQGGEDAQWAGLIAVYLSAPPEHRLERAVQAARLCGVRRAQGRPPVSLWRELVEEQERSPLPQLFRLKHTDWTSAETSKTK